MKKSRITSLLTVTLAAMSFFSCSNEIETPENGQMLNPGDAQISIGLGNGVTSYSTEILEGIINDGSGNLFKADGSEISLKGAKIETVAGKMMFTATVTAGSFTEGEKAKLYLYVNGKDKLSSTATGTAEAKFAASIVSTELTRDLGAGLPAGFGPTEVTLKGGTPIMKSVALKRAAARVGAVSVSGASIVGYKVTLNGVNTKSGAIFTAPIAGTAADKVERTLDGITTGMYKTSETVGYVYPSTGSTLTVAPPTGKGDPKTLPFVPVAGKNYTVNITPAKTDDATFNWEVTLTEWDSASGDIDMDFDNKSKLKLNNAFTEGVVSVKGGQLEIASDGNTSSTIDLINLVGNPDAGHILSADVFEVGTRGFADNSISIDNGENGKVTIKYPTLFKADGKKFTFTVSLFKVADGTLVEAINIPAVIKPILLPEGFLVDMGSDLNFTALNTQGSIAEDIALFNKVNATSTTGTFTEKLTSYMKKGATQFAEVVGAKFADKVAAQTVCPAGFKLPSQADYKKLLVNTFNIANGNWSTSNPTQYNVRTRNVMETIHDGSSATGAVVSPDYSVGIFDTGITGGDGANKSYRVFKYKNNSIVAICSSASTVYGGVYTSDGKNVGFNGGNSSSTLYTEADGSTPNMQVRCIKDAASSVW